MKITRLCVIHTSEWDHFDLNGEGKVGKISLFQCSFSLPMSLSSITNIHNLILYIHAALKNFAVTATT